VRVTFSELAERELNDAAQYYEHERPRPGVATIAEVATCVSPKRSGPNHRASLTPFSEQVGLTGRDPGPKVR
jgi:hypothetical protein